MKNTLSICAALLLAGGTAFAQDSENKAGAEKELSFKSVRGHEVLPQKGEWAIGISATGFLGYLGNMMNSSTFNNAPGFSVTTGPNAFAIGNLGGMAVTGKYMKSATMAYRVRFQANAGSTTLRNNVLKSSLTPDPLNPQYVQDEMTTDAHVVLLGAGFEKRRGSSRLQGIYGAELLAGFSGSRTVYNYGNAMSLDFTAPVSTSDFANGTTTNMAVRQRENASGTSMLFGARAFAGVEYFIAPKISLGGEIGYTLGFSTNGKGYVSTEEWYSGTNTVANVTRDTYANRGLRSFGAGLDNVNAGLNLHFYF
ncbi:MAG: hypothetical protein KF744_08175 [Taibaiella sp.]|nr:hypothetical protein [Taibaiella sp.]